jgi:hypothetical protein
MLRTHLSEVLPATFGVCFLGTPHRGSKVASLGKVAYDISKCFVTHANTELLRDLERNAETLGRVGRSFKQILVDRQVKVHSFREELPTDGIVVVDKFSAIIDDGLETVGRIHANHKKLAKFCSEEIGHVLDRWVAEIRQDVMISEPPSHQIAQERAILLPLANQELILEQINTRTGKHYLFQLSVCINTTTYHPHLS